mgnify:CR=1 FL=1
MDVVHKKIIVVFTEATSYNVATHILIREHAKIIHYNDFFNQFLIEVDKQRSEIVIKKLEQAPEIELVCEEPILSFCAVYRYAYDNFNIGATHGDKVIETMGDVNTSSIISRNVGYEDDIHIDEQKVADNLKKDFKAIKEDDKDIHIINFSFNVGWDKAHEDRSTYKKRYVDSLLLLTHYLQKCPSNLIITKAMGNESVHDMDDIFESAYEEIGNRYGEKGKELIKNHVVFVSAIDHKTKEEYSNRLEKLNENFTTATVIIDDLDWSGTSAAAPLLARWISEEAEANPNITAIEMMAALRKSAVPNSNLTNKFRLHEQLERSNKDQSNCSSNSVGPSNAYVGMNDQDLHIQMQAMQTLGKCIKKFVEQLEDAEMTYNRKLSVLDYMGVPVQVIDYYKSNCAIYDLQKIKQIRLDIGNRDLAYISNNIEQMQSVLDVATM